MNLNNIWLVYEQHKYMIPKNKHETFTNFNRLPFHGPSGHRGASTQRGAAAAVKNDAKGHESWIQSPTKCVKMPWIQSNFIPSISSQFNGPKKIKKKAWNFNPSSLMAHSWVQSSSINQKLDWNLSNLQAASMCHVIGFIFPSSPIPVR